MSRRPRISPVGWILGLALAAPGCIRMEGGEALTIATTWPAAECRSLEAEFRRWAQAEGNPGDVSGAIRWVRLAPGWDPATLADELVGVDLILGGPTSGYARLAERGWLQGDPGSRSWFEVGRADVGLAVDTRKLEALALAESPGWSDLGDAGFRGWITLDDVRQAPTVLALWRSRLDEGPWAEGYADLVRLAGNARPIGRREGVSLAGVERGEAVVTFADLEGFESQPDVSRLKTIPLSGSPARVEGAAILRDARHVDRAETFAQFLADRGGSRGASNESSDITPAAEGLLAELLGATLVDAQPELVAAWSALAGVEGDDRTVRETWMAEAPPWPPASVQVLRGRDRADAWIETLAREVAPDPIARAWLLESWRAAPRPIDGAFLKELAGAAGGRLATEPRLRAWLRAEWTAWARQRYEAVARDPGGAPAS